MKLTLHIGDLFPRREVLAQAAGRGVENRIIRHFRERNDTRLPNRHGLPKSNYWADASKDVATTVQGPVAHVEIAKEGVALHYEGGTVRPKPPNKALAIPIDPAVATIWPSEDTGDDLAVLWPKNSRHGFMKDANTGDLLWMLIPQATLRADETVLPSEPDMLAAAEDAIMEALS